MTSASLLTLLVATAPASDRADAMKCYGRLVGKWRTRISYLREPSREAVGEWEFAYALEGRAVIDVWQVPPRDEAIRTGETAECGLCVRVYDPLLNLWQFTFHGPLSRATIRMIAMPVGNEIVQECTDETGILRWIFSDISEQCFKWRSQRSVDGGSTWQVEQRVEAVRVSEPETVQTLTG